jgi:hypothetical protein
MKKRERKKKEGGREEERGTEVLNTRLDIERNLRSTFTPKSKNN